MRTIVWRRLSLSGKLFFAVAAVALLVLALVAGAVALNMRSGFSYYLLQAEMGRISRIADALSTRADAPAGWPALRPEAAWDAFVMGNAPMDAHRPPPPPGLRERDRRPPPPRPSRPPSHLPERLALFDAGGRLVAGPASGPGPFAWRDIVAEDGTTVLGRLRLHAPAGAAAPADRLFVRGQMRTLALVTLLAMALAAAVGWLLARQFVAPIREIGARVGRLAAGDYAQRLAVDRSDELGRLMADHNALAQSLETSRRREREWLSNASHELKTPLAVLRAEIEAMQDGVRQPTPAVFASLHAATMRLSRLVADLNVLASGAELGVKTGASVLDLGDLVREATEAMRSRCDGLQLDLRVEVGSRVPVGGDRERLRQVVDNLLDNACRYTNSPGRIEVVCERDGETARLTVRDTDPCPPADALPKLFERFYRVEGSRSRFSGGSGLGLAICRSIVEAHGGTISARQGPLGGLEMTIELPIAAEAAHGS